MPRDTKTTSSLYRSPLSSLRPAHQDARGLSAWNCACQSHEVAVQGGSQRLAAAVRAGNRSDEDFGGVTIVGVRQTGCSACRAACRGYRPAAASFTGILGQWLTVPAQARPTGSGYLIPSARLSWATRISEAVRASASISGTVSAPPGKGVPERRHHCDPPFCRLQGGSGPAPRARAAALRVGRCRPDRIVGGLPGRADPDSRSPCAVQYRDRRGARRAEGRH